MRRADQHLETVASEALEDADRRRNVCRTVVDARQEVGVNVDHARAAVASERTSLVGARSNTVPTTT
jgi:hypothetical protein